MKLEYLKKSKFTDVFNKVVLNEDKKSSTADELVKGAEEAIQKVEDDDDELSEDAFWDPNAETYVETADVEKTPDARDMPVWCQKRVVDNIALAYRTKKPLLIYGDPGIGKTTMVRTFAKMQAGQKIDPKTGKPRRFVNWGEASQDLKKEIIRNPSAYFLLIDVRAIRLEPSDIAGVPDMEKVEEYIEMKLSDWIFVMAQPSADGILFLDELNHADTRTLQSLFSVVEKELGNIKLADDFVVIAASNLGSEFEGNTLPPALTIRFKNGFLVADPQQWLEYARKTKVHPYIIAFVESNPSQHFNVKPKEGFRPGEAPHPYPSPRNIIHVSDEWKELDQQMRDSRRKNGTPWPYNRSINDKKIDAAHAWCGTNWAIAIKTFMDHFGLFDYKKIVGDADSGELRKMQKDKWHALTLYVLSKIKPAMKRSERFADEPDKISEEDKGYFIGVAKILNSLKKEGKITLFSYIKQDFPIEQVSSLLTFLAEGTYDKEVKNKFLNETYEEIMTILVGKEKTKEILARRAEKLKAKQKQKEEEKLKSQTK